MKTPGGFPELRMPAGLAREEMPDLLRYWYLGTRARRHMMLRRFQEVDGRAVSMSSAGGSEPAPKLLDVGSAWGFNVMALDGLGFEATGMDLVVDQFEVGGRIARENGIRFVAAGADAAALPFYDETFDVVTMVETLEHIFLDDRPAALAECFRVLRPGGAIALSTPNYGSLVERFKRFTSRRRWLRERLPTMCYPEEGTARDEYHPYSYHHPLPDDAICGFLENAGFEAISVTHFLFMLKNTPEWAYPPAAVAERLGEAIPGVRRLAATSCFTAHKS